MHRDADTLCTAAYLQKKQQKYIGDKVIMTDEELVSQISDSVWFIICFTVF